MINMVYPAPVIDLPYDDLGIARVGSPGPDIDGARRFRTCPVPRGTYRTDPSKCEWYHFGDLWYHYCMEITIIEATFTGRDGSLGYRTGRRYRLEVGRTTDGMTTIRKSTSKYLGYCPYASTVRFLQNWTRIDVLVS